MVTRLCTIAFDADDTLWHTERYFRLTQDYFAQQLAGYTDPDTLLDRLTQAERRNIGHYGFGIKGFTLSMIETAIEVTDGKVPAAVISDLLDAGREMLRCPVELLPHARETVQAAREGHKVLLLTKGDLLDQERKLAQSGLGDLFDGVEIVTDKTRQTYTRVFDHHGTGAHSGLMVGDSMRSDILPMLEAGGRAAHIPHALPWALEQADTPANHPKFHQLPDLSALMPLIRAL
jgi:putative hydrolase of the HAD superfamily